ncbi:MAG: alpha/beta hydrolase [Actinomycetota bacterium]|nr:alpha/beta hydrolase [Actinomycetota bacterium]
METSLLERRAVDVGGSRFEVVVRGEGTPTVVFVNGLGSPLEEWALVAPSLATRCRVVCYDRRVVPRGGPIPTRDAARSAADLKDVLQALGVSGPLVLVGHSWGGAIVRQFVLDCPDDVAGLVFVDASHEGIKGMIPRRPRATRVLYTSSTLMLRIGPLRRRLLRSLGFDRIPPSVLHTVNGLRWVAEGRTSRAEFAGIASSLRALAVGAPDLPPVPTRVLLAAGRSGWMVKLGAKQFAAVRAVWEKAVAGRSDILLESVANSGHYISLDQPQAVISAISDVVDQVALRRVG